jgi:hypothetical protein
MSSLLRIGRFSIFKPGSDLRPDDLPAVRRHNSPSEERSSDESSYGQEDRPAASISTTDAKMKSRRMSNRARNRRVGQNLDICARGLINDDVNIAIGVRRRFAPA